MTGLPAPGTPWPPKPYDQVLDACQEWQAWWTGDPDALRDYYTGGRNTIGYDSVSTSRSLRARSKRAWQAWWGRPQPTANPPKKLHVPVAADIGRIAASILLSEPVTFSPADPDTALAGLVDDVLNTDDTYSRMLVAEESASMLSGVFGRIVWDAQVSDHTWIDWVDADRAIPHFRWGQLVAVTFWTELDNGGEDNVVLRHLEHYSRGSVEHALYQGTATNLGRLIPLTEHEDTAHIPVTDGGFVPLGVDELGVEYFPNMRPNPQWRNVPALRHLGRSDLSIDVIQLLDAIDEVWSSWMNDLQIGRGRIIVSEDMLRVKGAGQGTTFDYDQTVYSPVGNRITKESSAESVIEAHQFEIRVDEHRATFEALLRQVLSRVGYSPLTFGLSDEVAATATEVGAKERDTNRTRSAKIRMRKSALSRLATTQMRVEAAVFNSPAPTDQIRVEWPNADQASPRDIAETADLLKRAEAASTETRVQMIHPEWTPEQVAEEVARIRDESSMPISILGPSESTFAAGNDDPMDELADDEEARTNTEPDVTSPE